MCAYSGSLSIFYADISLNTFTQEEANSNFERKCFCTDRRPDYRYFFCSRIPFLLFWAIFDTLMRFPPSLAIPFKLHALFFAISKVIFQLFVPYEIFGLYYVAYRSYYSRYLWSHLLVLDLPMNPFQQRQDLAFLTMYYLIIFFDYKPFVLMTDRHWQ